MKKIALEFIRRGFVACGIGPIVLGYLVIWVIIYSVIKRNTKKLNTILEQNSMIQNKESAE